MRRRGLRTFRAYRVRLERAKVEQITEGVYGPVTLIEALVKSVQLHGPKSFQPPIEKPPRAGIYANKVRRAELKPWIENFASQHPKTPPFGVILSAAKKAFHPRPVTEGETKAAIAELDLTLSPGKP